MISLNLNFDGAQGTTTRGYAELQGHAPMISIPLSVPPPLSLSGFCKANLNFDAAQGIATSGDAELQCHTPMISLNLNFDGAQGATTRGYAELQCRTPMTSLPPSLSLSLGFARPTSTSMLRKAPPQVDMRSCSAIRL